MIRLLGDMRAYNYVIIPIHDFDQVIYKIRAIDFDQQCFEGKLSVYRPQFFKENQPIMKLVKEKLTSDSIQQYKIEERSIVAKRLISTERRTKLLIQEMKKMELSLPHHLKNLKAEIYKFTKDKAFKECASMGDIMESALNFVQRNYENVSMTSLFSN